MGKTLRNVQMKKIEELSVQFKVRLPELFLILEKISLNTNNLFLKNIYN